MKNQGVYIYGFARAAEAPDLGCVGLEHAGGPGRVYAVPAGPVAAIVSDYDAQGRVMPIRRNMDPHDRVLRETLRFTTILPVTFGHVARTAQQVAAMLRRHEPAILREIERLEGKVEMGVRVTWDVDNIFKYMVDAHSALAALRDRTFGGGGPADPDDKIELGRVFEECLEAKRDDVADRLVAVLLSHATDVHRGRANGETIAADMAFLVPRQNTHAFREQVREVAAAWPAPYVFECSGPWAPFNFVRLELDSARRDGRRSACAC